MSRSLVKRGLACTTTATPPMTTKSTPASTSADISRVGRKSGQFATRPLPGPRQLPALLVHALQCLQPLRGSELEVLADQALVDGRVVSLGSQREPVTGRMERAIERLDGGIRRSILEPRDDRLRDAQAPRELGLRQAGRATGGADQGGGGHAGDNIRTI